MSVVAAKKSKRVHRVCVRCRKPAKGRFEAFCDTCNALIETEYDLDKAVLRDSPNPLERYFDLLPAEKSETLLRWDQRYTPCVHARSLGAALGMPRLYLKDETVLNTGSTKDRMAMVSLAYLWESGVRQFCTSSTGNSSTAYAHALTKFPTMRMYLFTADDFSERVNYGSSDQVVPFVLRQASFVDAFNGAAWFARKFGLVSERGFFNPGRREGLKLAFFEAAEQIPEAGGVDWYVQAVSSAMGVYGTYKGAKELRAIGAIKKTPRLLCVQQESCCPMVRAFGENSESIKPEHIVHKPMGIAKAILRGDPTRAYPYVRKLVLESNGTMVAVSEAQIREARKMVEEHEGISPCFSASTSLAGLIKLVREGKFPVSDTVMVNLTGRDRPASHISQRIHYMLKDGEGWKPEDPTDDISLAVASGPAFVETHA